MLTDILSMLPPGIPPELIAKLSPDQVAAVIDALPAKDRAVLYQLGARTNLAEYARQLNLGIEPATHHLLLLAHLEAVERGHIERLMVIMPPGSAKALALNTPIPTPDGWSTMGAIGVGDRVFDERGIPCRVTWKSQIWHDRPVYRVMTDCGDTIIADRDHEWLVRLCGKRPAFKVKETWQLARQRAKRPMVRRAMPLQLPETSLPIDPYLLGMWLGDGSKAGGRITAGDQDRAWTRSEIERLGYKTTDQAEPRNFGVLGVRGALADMALLDDPWHGQFGGKHIPAAYLRSSARQRLALLQGLIDSDGTVNPGGEVCFCSTNATLASGVAELVRSLGAKASVSETRAMLRGKDCGPAWRVHFFLQDAARLPRKRERTRNGKRTLDTYLTVEPFGVTDTVCIEVDSSSHLFLCGASMTPTHNSTYASVLFPAWFLGRNPGSNVIAASHTSDLASSFGRRVRNIFDAVEHRGIFGVSVSTDNKSADSWSTDRGGTYFAVGVGGAVSGRRADLGLIDDPVKSREDADSDRMRDRAWEWYLNDFKTRLKPGGRQVLITTRWHEDDLAGRLLATEPERWRVLRLPMIAEAGDPLGRAPGERLWPEWFTDQMVEDAKRDVRVWNALYQGEPAAQDGDYFKRDWFQEDERPPQKLAIYGASDYAVTEGGGDATEHGIFGVDAWSNVHLIDWWHGHTASDVWIEAQCDLILQHQPMCWFGESGPIRRAIEPYLLRRMTERGAFCRIEWLPSTADKPTRCRAFQALAASGKVFVPERASWKADVIGQLLRFPAGLHDDAVDVCSLLGRGLEHIRVPELVERQMQTRAHVGYSRAKRYA